MTQTKLQELKQTLHSALGNLDTFDSCIYLDYPDYPNIGDHLISLGAIYYLTNVAHTKINYIASYRNFSPENVDKNNSKQPIFFHGGGSLGDLWYSHQKFRESIISQYTDRPIIILPQTIYFKNEKRLEKAKTIFNNHPNLTIFARDNYSYELASQYFYNCRIIKSPDMAFQLIETPEFSFNLKKEQDSILYLSRTDQESEKDSCKYIQENNLVNSDWVSYQKNWKFNNRNNSIFKKTLVTIYGDFIQRCLLNPQEFLHRKKWINNQYRINKLDQINPSDLDMINISLNLAHSGIFQFSKYSLIITDRLHAHILSLILGIPHIFLSNSYYKNRAFYETWTHDIDFCHFITDTSQIAEAIEDMKQKII
jgi:pyruvyl transferase EpsO